MLEVPQTFDLRLARSLIKLKLLQECTCNAATIEPRREYLPGDNERRFASREALRSFLRTNDSCNTQSHVSEGVTCARARLLVGVRAKERGRGRGGGKKKRRCEPAARTKVGRAHRSPTP